MHSFANTIAVILLLSMLSCKESPMERMTGNKPSRTSENDGNKEKDVSKEDEAADIPVQISGAFLTTEFVPAPADLPADETMIGGRAEKDGTTLALDGLTVKGKLVNTATGDLIKEITISDMGDGNQFWVNVKTTDIASSTVKIEVEDSSSHQGSLSRSIADHAGTELLTMDPDKMFDFSETTPVAKALSAKSYCGSTSTNPSVMASVGPPSSAVDVSVATMVDVPAIQLDKTQTCFVKISQYTGTSATSLLGANERIGDFIGSGKANGGTIGCMFAVMQNTKSGEGDPKPKLYVFSDHSDAFIANMRKTAFEQRCQ